MMLIVYISIFCLFGPYEINANTANATLYQDNSNITAGVLTFVQYNSSSNVMITGTLTGVNASGSLGFHVHQYPVLEPFPNCTAAGAHYNPYNVSHGPPWANTSYRHVGDLGNVTSTNGTISINITDSIIQLYNGSQSIINLTIIVHSMLDDGGNTTSNNSAVTGNAGARLLCGLIRLTSDTSNTTTTTTTTSTVTTATTKPSKAISNKQSTLSILSITILFSYIFFY